MDNTTRLDRIKELLTKLHAGFEYMNANPDQIEQNQGLLERAESIYTELEKLGVARNQSQSVLIMGVQVTDKLIDSYKEKIPS